MSLDKKLSKKFIKLWDKCEPLLKKGRPDDLTHAREAVNFILNYQGKIKLDCDILIPVAMMHDIGHSAILPEHFKFITGPEKVDNGKLVHMLAGAKMAKDILSKINYDKKQSIQIIDIISIHDADQLKGAELEKAYNTENKKIFHDVDSLDRYTVKRINNLSYMYKDKGKLFKVLREFLGLFFYEEFRTMAEQNLGKIEKNFVKK